MLPPSSANQAPKSLHPARTSLKQLLYTQRPPQAPTAGAPLHHLHRLHSRTTSSVAAAPQATMVSRSRSREDNHLHQKRKHAHHRLLPSPPRPARGARREGRVRRRTSTTSPASQPERGEGEDEPETSAANTAIGDATGRHTLKPTVHLTSRRRRTGVPPLSRRRGGRRRGEEPPAWPAARWGTRTRLLIACYRREREDKKLKESS